MLSADRRLDEQNQKLLISSPNVLIPHPSSSFSNHTLPPNQNSSFWPNRAMFASQTHIRQRRHACSISFSRQKPRAVCQQRRRGSNKRTKEKKEGKKNYENSSLLKMVHTLYYACTYIGFTSFHVRVLHKYTRTQNTLFYLHDTINYRTADGTTSSVCEIRRRKNKKYNRRTRKNQQPPHNSFIKLNLIITNAPPWIIT